MTSVPSVPDTPTQIRSRADHPQGGSLGRGMRLPQIVAMTESQLHVRSIQRERQGRHLKRGTDSRRIHQDGWDWSVRDELRKARQADSTFSQTLHARYNACVVQAPHFH